MKILTCFVAMLSWVVPTLLAQAGQAVPVGKVVTITGLVLIRPNSSDTSRKVHALKPNEPLYEGDVINTSSTGNAKLLLADRSIIDVTGGSMFHLKSLKGDGPDRQVELSLPFGQARAAVTQPISAKGRYRVRSRAATMGVRGTEFVIQTPLSEPSSQSLSDSGSSQPNTTVTVLQGKVAVTPDAPSRNQSAMSSTQVLTAGTVASISTATATSAGSSNSQQATVQLSPISGITNDRAREVRISDRTALQAITLDPSSSSRESRSTRETEASRTAATITSSSTSRTPSSSTADTSASSSVESGSSTEAILQGTLIAPPAEVAQFSAPEAVIAQATGTGPSRKGEAFAGTIEVTDATSAVPAPLQQVGGGTRRISITVHPR